MKDLLPFVERELSLFGDYFRRFAEEYPAIAGELKLQSDSGGDPFIRNLTQAAAVLNARTAKKLDDDYPELTSSFLEMLAPHLTRPFPSCSIAHFDHASGGVKAAGPATIIPRGTQLKTAERKRDGIICKFRSAYPVTLAPILVASAKFLPSIQAPPGMRLPLEVTSEIAIAIEWGMDVAGSTGCPVGSLRLFVDGDPSVCAAVLDTLFLRTVRVYAEAENGHWQALDKTPLKPVGLNDDEALLPTSAKTQSALRLLTEYFCFPGKFNFFDIELSALTANLPVQCQRVTLHFALTDVSEDADVARLLRPLSAKHLLTGCTPIVNLFTQAACPIRLNHTARQYTLIPDALRASAYQVYSVDNVRMVRDSVGGAGPMEFRPYYSLRHGEEATKKGHYWIMRRDEVLAVTNPGYENLLSFIDIDFAPFTATSSTISVELTCCNGDLPSRLDYGAPGGDLAVEASIGNHRIRLMRRPTLSCPSSSGRNLQWKLASHLALSMSSLCQDGLPAFQEMLAMHDRYRSAVSRRQISGIVGLKTAPARAWLRKGKFGGSIVHGVEVRMTIDEAAFAGSGLHVFAQLMDRFLGMYVHLNSFTQLTIVSHTTERELLKCPPRNGELNLL